jgi:DNA primase
VQFINNQYVAIFLSCTKAPELKLPEYIFKPLRTNTHYLTLIRSITYLHQYQLPVKKTKNGTEYIETTLEHIAIANELSKELLLRKSDELGGQLRNFFEELKRHCKRQEKQGFFAKEIRIKYRYHPQKLKRYLDELEHRSYIKKIGGYIHKQGFEYEIAIWDDYQILKDGINILDKVLEQLKSKNKSTSHEPEEGKNHNGSQHFHTTFTNHIVTVNGKETVN